MWNTNYQKLRLIIIFRFWKSLGLLICKLRLIALLCFWRNIRTSTVHFLYEICSTVLVWRQNMQSHKNATLWPRFSLNESKICYAVLKSLTWDLLSRICQQNRLVIRLGKAKISFLIIETFPRSLVPHRLGLFALTL